MITYTIGIRRHFLCYHSLTAAPPPPVTGRERKTAFTLAETLITLGIIGVVAALTIPAIIQRHTEKVVEARLKKFYSSVNLAIKLSEIDNGTSKNWWGDWDTEYSNGSSFDHIGWFNRYIKPYVKVTKTGKIKGSNNNFVIFADGSAMEFRHGGMVNDINFYPGNPEKCLKKGDEYKRNGKCSFTFIANENKNGYEPYAHDWNGEADALYNADNEYACKEGAAKFYCTKIIQLNNWEIPDNYPYKVSY